MCNQMAWGRVNEVEQSCFKFGVYWIKVPPPKVCPRKGVHGGGSQPWGNSPSTDTSVRQQAYHQPNPWNKQTINQASKSKITLTSGVVEQPATPEVIKEENNEEEIQPNGDVQQEEESKYLKFYPYMTSDSFLPKLPIVFQTLSLRHTTPPLSEDSEI